MEPEQPQQQQQRALFEQWREHQQQEEASETELKASSLLDLLCEFNGGCTPSSLHRHIRKRYAENLNYLQQLAGITEQDVKETGNGQREFNEELPHAKKTTIITAHLKNLQYEIFPAKLTHSGADHTFALRGYLRVTIRQYFYIRHRVKLRYPQLPLICVPGGNQHNYFYPIECLEVLEWKN